MTGTSTAFTTAFTTARCGTGEDDIIEVVNTAVANGLVLQQQQDLGIVTGVEGAGGLRPFEGYRRIHGSNAQIDGVAAVLGKEIEGGSGSTALVVVPKRHRVIGISLHGDLLGLDHGLIHGGGLGGLQRILAAVHNGAVDDGVIPALIPAGEIAGLKVRRIINEPTAAALAYGLDKGSNEQIAVYDLGGGTFDISVLEIGDGVFEVKASDGDTHLGGDDWDNAIINWILAEFKAAEGMDISHQTDALQRIKEEAEKAKIALSSTQSYDISLPFITMDATGPKHIMLNLTRSKLEQLTENLLERTSAPVRNCISAAGLSTSDINELVLVGGMTRMPAVQEMAKRLAGKEPHKGVNPDEVVAVGAAIQGGVLSGSVTDVLLLDVTPLTLSIETMGSIATPMIDRNTTIPVRKSQVFSTAADNQPAVDIRICQGERKMFNDNKLLGNFKLDGIKPAPRGVPQIEVTFDIDANGILKVTAKDKDTGKEQNISIQGSSGLSKEEIERAKRDAEMHAEEDRRKAEEIEAINKADSLAHSVERQIKEMGEQVPADVTKPIQDKVDALKKAAEAKDVDKCKTLTTELETMLANLQQAAQQAAAAQQGGCSGSGCDAGAAPQDGPRKAKGKVVDAEVVDND